MNSCFGSIIDVKESIDTVLNIDLSQNHALQNSIIYCPDFECNIKTMIDNENNNTLQSFEGLMNTKIIAQTDTQNVHINVNGDGILKNATIIWQNSVTEDCLYGHCMCVT